MGMSVSHGKGGRVRPSMNVTPLVDVVLVLLIIFMVITPLLTKQFYVHLPKQEKTDDSPTDPNAKPLVLSVDEKGLITLNGNLVSEPDLSEKLKRVFAARNDHVLFFDAADKAPYGKSVKVLDTARAGGAVTIAILTERPKGVAN